MKKIIALDLEGTLVSNAVSLFPRAGLYHFLEFCNSKAEKIVLFTAVTNRKAREIIQFLSAEKNKGLHLLRICILEQSKSVYFPSKLPI